MLPADASPSRPRAVIVRNPLARRGVDRARLAVAARTAAPSWSVEVRDTHGPDDPRVLARAAAEDGADVVLALGGDGTLNGVVNGVREAGRPDVAVGVIAGGTANVWAHEARVPLDVAGALRLLEGGRRVRVDLGVARVGERERRFLLMCGIGLDAAVVEAVERRPRLKRRLAQGAFAIAAVEALGRRRPVPVEVDADGVRTARSLVLGVAGNSRLYGGVTRLASAAEMDDGLLDLVTFEARGGWRRWSDTAVHVGRGLRIRRAWHETRAVRFAYERAARFVLHPAEALPLQLDGEAFTSCGPDAPLTLEVDRAALTVLVPPGANPLFARM